MLKKDGFTGEKAIVLPEKVLTRISESPVNDLLHITDIGYYPTAQYHHRLRKAGAEQHILIYCVAGQGLCRLDGAVYNVQANEFVVIPKGTPHLYAADQQNPWSIYWAHFNGVGADVLAKALLEKVVARDNRVAFDARRIGLFDEMYENLQQGYGRQPVGYANTLFWHFMGTFLYEQQLSREPSHAPHSPVEKGIQFIRDNIRNRFSVQDIASAVNLSASHFSMLFKASTGYSPLEYANHLKIQRACQLLQFTTMRVNEVATELGLDDPYYFTRLFTKTMGLTPKAYKKTRLLAEASTLR